MLRGILVFCITGLVFGQSAAKRPLSHRDYDGWKTILNTTLSRDGAYLAYALFPQEGDGELVLRDLRTGAERRESVGALPPPPTADDNLPVEETPPPRGVRIHFGPDRKSVIFSILPTKAQRDAARKRRPVADPKEGLGILDLTSQAPATRIADVRTFSVPSTGKDFAYLSGKVLVWGPQKFKDVEDFSLSRDGVHLVYSTATAVYLVEGTTVTALASGKGSRFAWSHDGKRLAFVANGLWIWDRGSASARKAELAGLRQDWEVSELASLSFSRDGSRVFFGAIPRKPPVRISEEEYAVADLWHYRDPFIQPMQKVRAARDRSRAWRAVYHISERRFVQLADDTLTSLSLARNGRYAVGGDERSYRSLVDYDRPYTDVYLVDTLSGERRKLLEKTEAAQNGALPSHHWAPDGSKVLFYRDRHWHVLNVSDGRTQNISAGLPVKVFNEDMDRPSSPSSYGSAGWLKDSNSVLIYDRFDVWQIRADGSHSRNVTDGVGRKERIQFRILRWHSPAEDEGDEDTYGIDAKAPLLLRAENLDTRDSGFWRDRIEGDKVPEKLLMGPRNYRLASKARHSNRVIIIASRFDEAPELQVTDADFREPQRVTDSNPQKAGYLWGTSELVPFTSTDGTALRAVLYKPENFDPKKKYPMLVYIYERLSHNLHTFVEPKPGTSINISYYVSNGYLVLTPDIVYSTGAPGPSALKCVLPAVQAVVDRGYVKEDSIGIQGHSWGGYQIAYMVTQTSRFRAAEAGAPVSNMTSAYNGIRWGSGMPRQFQYERDQSRMGASLWQLPLAFIENSPVFHVQTVTTPLLLLHNDQDDAVPWYQGIELYLSLRRFGKEVYLFNYNGEKHGIRKRVNQKDYTVRMQQFFDHHLRGAAKPAWMERGIPFVEREQEKLQSQSDH